MQKLGRTTWSTTEQLEKLGIYATLYHSRNFKFPLKISDFFQTLLLFQFLFNYTDFFYQRN